jgi:predicted SnoaL-like aldol condensation-catalyzing enzyme
MKYTLAITLLASLLTCGQLASAQEPVVGVADPESLFVDADPVKHRNKQAALHIMRELLQCRQWDMATAGQWITDRYIQHNPNAGSGLEGVVAYFSAVTEPTATCDTLTTPVVAVTAEGDLVTVMIAREYKDANGNPYTSTWFDTWRFVDGKADEHWDPATK